MHTVVYILHTPCEDGLNRILPRFAAQSVDVQGDTEIKEKVLTDVNKCVQGLNIDRDWIPKMEK